MAIEWGLLDQNAFQRGYQQTKGVFDDIAAKRKQNALDAAYRRYAMNPSDPTAINALAVYDPKAAIDLRQSQQAAHLKLLDAHRDSIKIGANVIRSTRPADEASWQRTRSLYAQAGGDLTDVPEHWDETTAQYVTNVTQLADALTPEKTPNTRIITPQPGGGAWELGADGRLKPLITPNDGSHAVGSEIPTDLPLVIDQATYDAVPPGSQYRTQDGHTRLKTPKEGGQTVIPSGPFPDIGPYHRY